MLQAKPVVSLQDVSTVSSSWNVAMEIVLLENFAKTEGMLNFLNKVIFELVIMTFIHQNRVKEVCSCAKE
jgi:hypothetical protein